MIILISLLCMFQYSSIDRFSKSWQSKMWAFIPNVFNFCNVHLMSLLKFSTNEIVAAPALLTTFYTALSGNTPSTNPQRRPYLVCPLIKERSNGNWILFSEYFQFLFSIFGFGGPVDRFADWPSSSARMLTLMTGAPCLTDRIR